MEKFRFKENRDMLVKGATYEEVSSVLNIIEKLNHIQLRALALTIERVLRGDEK